MRYYSLRVALGGLIGLLAIASPKAAEDGFAGSAACAECHEAEAALWRNSDHAWAWRSPEPDNVLGDFDEASFEQDGLHARFHRDERGFWIETQGPDGAMADFLVAYAVGVRPLQQYLIELPGGRLQAFSVAWDTRSAAEGGQRWFSLQPGQRLALDDALRWTGAYQNWNGRCGECHATGYAKNYDAAARTFGTTWAELGVTCEACHGAGAAHVASAKDGRGKASLVVDFDETVPAIELDVCARCHALREWVAASDRIDDPFLDRFAPVALGEGFYFADGQQQGEVYTYGSFAQSRMHAAGVRCSDCHDAHSGALKIAGNSLCAECHGPSGNARFPSLRQALYDDASHHHHRPGAPGSQCVDCHMPGRVYMAVDARADHGFRVPRPLLAAGVDAPDPCTGCHEGQDEPWAANVIAGWTSGGAASEPPSWPVVLLRARAGDPSVGLALTALAANVGVPAIVRASAIELHGAYAQNLGLVARTGLEDSEPMVRRAAATAAESVPVEDRVALVGPALGDPIRSVRTEAARVLLGAAIGDPAMQLAFEAARAELAEAQAFVADYPEGQLNLAAAAYAEGNADAALAALEEALRLDPYLSVAWTTYAHALTAKGDAHGALDALRRARALLPEDGPIARDLGLILAETGQLDDAVRELGAAARLMPGDARVRYNLGVLLEAMGRPEEAERALLEGLAINRVDPDILYALAYHRAQRGDAAGALTYARTLIEVAPNDARALALIEAIGAGSP